jgi:DNA end-binding protein Ku
MARPYWSGNIQISLVSFGVHLFTATEAASEIHFHLIDRRTGERVKHQNVRSSAVESNPDEAADPVEKSNIVKGYEYARGQYVTLEPDELAHLRVPSKRTMEVTQFVDLGTIDPEYFERPFFVVPADASQTEAFLTIRQALLDTQKVALTRIAFAGREHVVAIAPAAAGSHHKSKSTKSKSTAHPGLMAYTLRFAAELRSPATYFESINQLPITDDSLALAKELIQRKSATFDPAKFTDGYEAAVKELVAAKLKHKPIPREEPPAPRHKNVILIDALRKSVSSSTKSTDTRTATTTKPASKKLPRLVKSASKPHTQHKPSRTSPTRKTA